MSDIKKRVTAIQGVPVTSIQPNLDEVLKFDGTEYVPSLITFPGMELTGPAGGDLSGDYPNPIVINLTGVDGLTTGSSLELQGALITESIISHTNLNIYTEGDSEVTPSISLESNGGYLRILARQNGDPQFITINSHGPNGNDTFFPSSFLPVQTAQIGLDPRTVRINGSGIILNNVKYVHSDYEINSGSINDFIVAVDTVGQQISATTGPVEILLPSTAGPGGKIHNGETYIITDLGNASTYPITVTGYIEAEEDVSIVLDTNFASVTLICVGHFFKIISRT